VLNPELARFFPGSSETAQVEVNSEGIAAVDIEIGQQANMQIPRGTAAIEIEVVRPKRAIENIPELRMAIGNTTVTWIAPQLELNVGGPDMAVPGQILNYFATVANVGDVDAENVEVTVQFPPGMQMDSPNIKPTISTPVGLKWEIGPLPPRRAVDLSFNLVATSALDGVVSFRVTGLELEQVKSIRTLVQQPQITLRVVPRPETTQVEVGGEAVFDVTVTNAGNKTINDLAITMNSDPGLQHDKDNLNSVVSVIGFLNPGQSTTVTGIYRVEREGDLSVRATAQALGQTLASSQPATIRSLPARPKTPAVRLQISSDLPNPAVLPVGRQFTTNWRIMNTGEVPLRNPIVSMQHSPNLIVKGLSDGGSYDRTRQLGQWRLQQVIPPGFSVEMSALFQGDSAGNQATVQVSIDSEGVVDKQSLILDISNSGSGNNVMPPGSGNGLGGNQPGGGQLQKPALTLDDQNEKRLSITIQPVSNSIRKGDIGIYEIRIENLINKPDQRVALSILTPTGSVLKSIRAKDLRYKLSNKDRQIDLEPIKYFRPNDSFSCVVQLKHDEVVAGELIASVTSLGQTNPVSTSLNIQVLER